MDALLNLVWLVGALALILGGQVGLFWNALGLGLLGHPEETMRFCPEVIEPALRCLVFAAISCLATVAGVALLIRFFST